MKHEGDGTEQPDEPKQAGDVAAQAPAEPGGVVTRRNFGRVVLGTATAGYCGAIGYPVARYLLSGAEVADEGSQVSEVSLGAPDDIKPGTGKNIAFGSRPALVVRDKEGVFSAFLATCSHLGCTVAFEPSTSLLRCPCHGGAYDPKTGKNVSGPPPKPLEPLDAVVEAGKLVVRRRKA